MAELNATRLIQDVTTNLIETVESKAGLVLSEQQYEQLEELIEPDVESAVVALVQGVRKIQADVAG